MANIEIPLEALQAAALAMQNRTSARVVSNGSEVSAKVGGTTYIGGFTMDTQERKVDLPTINLDEVSLL